MMKKLFSVIWDALGKGQAQALIGLAALIVAIISLPFLSPLWNHQTTSTLVVTRTPTNQTTSTSIPVVTFTSTATNTPIPTSTVVATSTSQSQNNSTTPLQAIQSFCTALSSRNYQAAYVFLSSQLQASYKSETNFAHYYGDTACYDMHDYTTISNPEVDVDTLMNNNQQLCAYHFIQEQSIWYINTTNC